jgi:MFS family permease
MLGFALATMGLAYLDRVCISTAAPAIQRDLGLTKSQLALVFSAFTLAYAVFEIPSGWLADRFGARRMVARIVAWWSLMTAATGAAAGFASLAAVRFLFGVGEAGVLPSLASAFRRWLPPRERGVAFGLTVAAAALGGALTQPLVARMLQTFSWRTTFVCFGALGGVWAAVWYLWVRDDPREHRGVDAAELALIGPPERTEHPRVPWARLVRSRNLYAICGMYFCAIYGWYFYITWLPTYLLEARGFDLAATGWLSSLPLYGIAAGCLIGGVLSDGLVRRRGPRVGLCAPGVVGLPLAALAVLGAIQTSDGRSAAYFLSAAAGLAALGIASAWSTCVAIGGRHGGVVSGAMNTFGNLGGTLSPIVFGQSLDHLGSWSVPLASVAGLYVASALLWLGIDPRVALEESEPPRAREPALEGQPA